MICLIQNNTIILGPIAWGDPEIIHTLYRAGLTETPDKPLLPAAEPAAAVTLEGGYSIALVTIEPDSPPDGQVVTGHTTTYANGTVTIAPVYGAQPAPPAPPAPTLTQAQAQVCAAINTARDAVMYGTFTDASGNTWQVDQASRALLTGAEAKIADGMALPADFAWVNSANAPVPMTADSFKALTQAVFNWTENVFTAALAMKAQVMAMTDPAVVLAYRIPDWPTA